jgi:putative nucleotidyltransferase with HDIG domain
MSSPHSEPPQLDGKIKGIIQGIERLRPLPGSATRIIRALEDPHITVFDLAGMLSLDQALAAYILQTANSASLGYTSPCSSLKDAVMRLGFKRVGSLVMNTVAAGPLSRRLYGYRLGDGELWNHSVSTATIAQYIARVVSYPEPEEAYLAGLLHDIGKLLLDQYISADYQQIVLIMHQKKVHLWQVEEDLFGIDHSAVGGLMAKKWNFPNNLIAAIGYHHAPSIAKESQTLPAIVNLASASAPVYSSAFPGNSFAADEQKTIHQSTLQILHFDQKTLEQMLKRMGEYMKFGGLSS